MGTLYRGRAHRVNTFFNVESLSVQVGGILWAHVPKRPTLQAPAFGAWLESMRGEHRSHEQIAQQLRPYVADARLKVDRSSVKKLEEGRVPNWPMIYAISRVHKTPVPDVLLRLAGALVLVTRTGHGSTKNVTQSKLMGPGQTNADKSQNSLLPTSIPKVQDAPIPQEAGGADPTISAAKIGEVVTAFSEATEQLAYLSDALAEQLADLGLTAPPPKTRSRRGAQAKGLTGHRAPHR